MSHGLHIIKTPSGKYHFIGKVPIELAFNYSDNEYVETAIQCGLSVAKKHADKTGGYIENRVFDTKQDAETALTYFNNQ